MFSFLFRRVQNIQRLKNMLKDIFLNKLCFDRKSRIMCKLECLGPRIFVSAYMKGLFNRAVQIIGNKSLQLAGLLIKNLSFRTCRTWSLVTVLTFYFYGVKCLEPKAWRLGNREILGCKLIKLQISVMPLCMQVWHVTSQHIHQKSGVCVNVI